MANLKARADELEPRQWKRLERPAKYDVATEPRQRPDNVKEEIVRQRGFDNIRQGERFGEPTGLPCRRGAEESVGPKESRCCLDIRYFFYITNRSVRPTRL